MRMFVRISADLFARGQKTHSSCLLFFSHPKFYCLIHQASAVAATPLLTPTTLKPFTSAKFSHYSRSHPLPTSQSRLVSLVVIPFAGTRPAPLFSRIATTPTSTAITVLPGRRNFNHRNMATFADSQADLPAAVPVDKSSQPGATASNPTASDSLHLKNVLDQSRSPYVRGHMNNPVAWQTWGPEALKLAKDNGRMLFVSIGYAACHCQLDPIYINANQR